MHISIDTSQPLTDRDRRVLAALITDDSTPLALPRFDGPDMQKQDPPHAPTTPPLPVPVPAEFAQRLGDAVSQFSPRGSASEARLPVSEQAGVRTSSTMPDDDGAELETQISERMAGATLGPNAERGDADARVPEPVETSDVVRAGVTVPRDLVEDGGPPRRIEDVTRAAILGVVEQPPVRHTSP